MSPDLEVQLYRVSSLHAPLGLLYPHSHLAGLSPGGSPSTYFLCAFTIDDDLDFCFLDWLGVMVGKEGFHSIVVYEPYPMPD